MVSDLLSVVDPTLFVYVGFALGAFLVFTGVFQVLSRRENRAEARTRRMKMIAQGATTEEMLAILKPPPKGTLMERVPFIGSVPAKLRQAGSPMSPARFLMICLAVTVVVGTVASVRFGVQQAMLLGVGLGLLGPIAVLDKIKARRLDRMTQLLPDALDLMARGLRVGHPLNTTIASVAREMPDPIATEFGIIADQISFGDDLVDAVAEFAQRVDLEDVHYLSASIAIQHGTGGDLASIVDTLSRVIRNRIALRRKVKAVSAEGRLTAYFLTAVPFLIFGMNMVLQPDYYLGVRDDPIFLPMAIAIVVFVVLNGVVLNKLTKIKY